MFDVGFPEIVLVLVVALIVFGPGRLPELGAMLGKAIKDFRDATTGLAEQYDAELKAIDKPEDERITEEITGKKSDEPAGSAS